MISPGIVLLAAGGSRRMGFPKQLIEFKGKKMIQVVAERLLACGAVPTAVVLGANASAIGPALAGYGLCILQNPEWESGMAGSIRCGVGFVESAFPDTTHLLLALVDQPFVEALDYQALLAASKAFPEKVVATEYAGQVGAPMVFPRKYFPLLAGLQGDQGARAVVRGLDGDAVLRIPVPAAAEDWDLPSEVKS
ncbi:MAG TPA: nucleotidyltransferase family protein [Bacteroidia bacterium]|nr:nucleotidyltransferase family protein [Bacteroidia bacterium]